jgi:hypothetical protein
MDQVTAKLSSTRFATGPPQLPHTYTHYQSWRHMQCSSRNSTQHRTAASLCSDKRRNAARALVKANYSTPLDNRRYRFLKNATGRKAKNANVSNPMLKKKIHSMKMT